MRSKAEAERNELPVLEKTFVLPNEEANNDTENCHSGMIAPLDRY